MKRSLKIHIFIHVLILASLIVFANRTIAQWLLLDQMKSLLRDDLVSSYEACEDKINQTDQFFSCHRKLNPGNILNSFADSYVLCPHVTSANFANRPLECDLALQQSDMWRAANQIPNQTIELGTLKLKGEIWLAVRRNVSSGDDRSLLMVNESTALKTVSQLWSFRDRNLVFALPIILLMLMTLAIYLTYLLTRAIDSLEKALTGLNVDNLEQTRQINAPFSEFENLVSVFENLRKRLIESFSKTRRFVADASHELRTPLTILRGNSELMINELPEDTRAYEQVKKIHEEAERLIEITEKLLMLSRADANNIVLATTKMNVSKFLEDLIEEGVETFANIKFLSDIQSGVYWYCDEALIVQLIHNLYANAIKYNKVDGWIQINLNQTKTNITLKIANSTEVLSEELNARAFERFYRGNFSHSRQADGQGLGLSIALEIAKAHKANLSIQAEHQRVELILDIAV